MGQKVNPAGLRLGINKDWTAKWYAPSKDFSATLENDMKIRNFLDKKLKNAAVSSVTIERSNKKLKLKSVLQNQVLLLDTVEKKSKN